MAKCVVCEEETENFYEIGGKKVHFCKKCSNMTLSSGGKDFIKVMKKMIEYEDKGK